MTKMALIYSTVDGHTLRICEKLAEIAKQHAMEVAMIELTPESAIDIDGFDRVVIGASIRYGKHRPEVQRFVNDNLAALDAVPSAFFSVNAVARKAEKRSPDSNPYVRKFLAKVRWKPSLIGIFAGRICYAKYGFLDRTMIRFIMWLTGGPTNLDADVDFTDWAAVEDVGKRVCAAE